MAHGINLGNGRRMGNGSIDPQKMDKMQNLPGLGWVIEGAVTGVRAFLKGTGNHLSADLMGVWASGMITPCLVSSPTERVEML